MPQKLQGVISSKLTAMRSELQLTLERFRTLVVMGSMGIRKQDYFDKSTLCTLSLICFLGLFGAYLLYLLLMAIQRKRTYIGQMAQMDNDTSQALCAVFTPTSVAWPLLCAKFFKKTNVRKDKCGRYIELDVSEVLRHVYSGELEIRDSKDLGVLFRRELRVYGWDLGFNLGRMWWLETAKWITKLYFVEAEASTRITTRNVFIIPFVGVFNQIVAFTEGLSCQWPLSCALRVASRPRPSFDLDFVPYHDIGAEIQRIQSLHQQGNSTTVEFSCLGSAIRFMSSDFVLCAVPFLPNDEYMPRQMARINRTSTPLFVKLEDVIALLSSTGALSVNSIENISLEHAIMLYNLEQELVYNKNLRKEHIKDVSLEGWRKDRFMLAWEAGLLVSRKLVRWRIKVGD